MLHFRRERLMLRASLLAAALIVLIAFHGLILYFASSHLALSGALASGLIALVVIKHLGYWCALNKLFWTLMKREPVRHR